MRTLAILVAAVITLAGCSSNASSGSSGPAGPNSSARFVTKISQDATATATDASALIAEASTVITNSDPSGLTQLAADAQALHGHLTDFRSQILGSADGSDSTQIDFVSAENDLKNACGSLSTWTGSLNAKDNATWQTQMGTAVGEWNQDVTAIWAKAGVTPVPTISLPTG